jgi:PKD repeat protein
MLIRKALFRPPELVSSFSSLLVKIFGAAFVLMVLTPEGTLAQSCSTLADATHAPSYTWTTGGDANWLAQDIVTNLTGHCAAQSGEIDDDQDSWVQTVVTGRGLLSFYWKVSSENDYDYLSFYINGTRANRISGEVGWQQRLYDLTANVSTLRWVYAKDGSETEGSDAGWMTDFVFLPYTGRLIVASGNLAFGNLTVGNTTQRTFFVSSLGDEDVAVSDIQCPPGYTVSESSFIVSAGSTSTVTVTFTPVAPVVYAGLIEIESDAQSGISSLPVSGRGLLAMDRYVSTNSPSPEPPYSSWNTAAHTIQEALDVAFELDTVWVTNGVYDEGGSLYLGMTNRLVVNTGVVVRSVNGPEVTVIVGAEDPAATTNMGCGPAAVRGVVLLQDSVLNGFTVINGHSGPSTEGGGVWCADSSPLVENCVLSSNTAQFGGGIRGGTIQNSRIVNNRAMIYGGGACEANVRDCRLEGNSVDEFGGGQAYGSAARCWFSDNRAQNGGGVYAASVTNCVLIGNTATSSGGGAYGAWEMRMDNCTLTGNTAHQGGGMAYVNMHNSVIYHNTALYNPNWVSSVLGGSLNACCTVPPPSYELGNITNDPQIVSLSDPHLLPTSPCIDAGSNEVWSLLDIDIDGESRLNGDRVDIGADEFWGGGVTDALYAAISLPMGDTMAPGYSILIQADITGRCEQTLWTLPDGLSLTNVALFFRTFTNAGLYEIRLQASNRMSVVSAVATVRVQDVQYHVATNGNDMADGLSWSTAKQTIQAAVDACRILGGRICVSNGVYDAGSVRISGWLSRVAVTNPIHVSSLNGPSKTTILGATDPLSTNAIRSGSNSVRCVYLADGANLSGFTLQSGVSDYGGGGICCNSDAAWISNCIIRDCSAMIMGGAAYRGTLVQCVLTNNLALEYGGGTYYSVLYNSRIIGNSSIYGGGISGGYARNCLVAGNHAGFSGGGVRSAALENCTVVGNSATEAGGMAGGSGTNSIIWYNEAVVGPNWSESVFNSAPLLTASCTTPLPGGDGTGNFDDAPHLTGFFDAHLLPGSPCLNAGVSQAWMNAATDLDGEPRVSASGVDVGCDQFWADSCTGALSVAVLFPRGARVTTGKALPMIADVRGRVTSLLWLFGDGVYEADQPMPQHTYAAPGNYVVTLYAFNSSGLAQGMVTVRVDNAVWHVAPSGDDSADGLSWSSPKQTIQAAIDAASFGGLVLVSNGVYASGVRCYGGMVTSNRVVLTNEITLRGVSSDPAMTVIVGQASTEENRSPLRCLLMTPGTRVENLSLTNGNTGHAYMRDFGGGVYCVDSSCVLSNCVVSGCQPWMYGGGAYQGALYNCRLEHNIGSDGGGAYDAWLYDCVVTGNVARSYSGGGVNGGQAVRCEISGNAASEEGGGAYNAILSNCVVRGNGAEVYGGGMSQGAGYNSLIVDNIAGDGVGGVFMADLFNCTVVGNAGGILGGSMFNCIAYSNSDYNWNTDDSSYYRYTCAAPLPDGEACIAGDPVFVDAAAGDYRLASASPCVNAGSNQTWMTGSTDLAGSNRIQRAVVDLGAYESSYWGYAADVDGDRYTDWTEVNVLGTDPTNSSSLLQLSGLGSQVSGVSTGLVVRWQSVAGKLYQIGRSTNLVVDVPFTNLFTNVIGQVDYTTVTDMTATAAGPYFYRVEIDP